MPFPTDASGVGKLRPFRKLTLDVDGVETVLPSSTIFERQQMSSGKTRLLIAVPHPDLFRLLAGRLAEPVFVLYVLHTPRDEAALGRYQSPPLESAELNDFLADFTTYFAGDARHDIWVHSATDGRTLVWDRHDSIYAEGEPLEDVAAALGDAGFQPGTVFRPGVGPHIHYYRAEFDEQAAALLGRFDWTVSDLRPEDEQ
jgi:hypothetical protein